jgi:prepilin-type N-terminal cleavage/methylation domain-containing protein
MKKGFTLIELLVVIAIIGVLSAIGLVSFKGANQKARDSRRAADIQEIRSALEMYKTDSSTGTYPDSLDDSGLLKYFSNRQIPTDPQSKSAYTYEATTKTGSACADSSSTVCTSYQLSYTKEVVDDEEEATVSVYNP